MFFHDNIIFIFSKIYFLKLNFFPGQNNMMNDLHFILGTMNSYPKNFSSRFFVFVIPFFFFWGGGGALRFITFPEYVSAPFQ